MEAVEMDSMGLGDLYLPAEPASFPGVITGSVLARPVLAPNDTPVGIIFSPALRLHTQKAFWNSLLLFTPHPVLGES